MTNLKSTKGVTLIELLITIIISSVIISMLMGLLSMTLTAKAKLEYDNRMLNESYYIGELLQNRVFSFGPQYAKLIQDDSNQTVIELYHYDITVDPNTGEIKWDNTSEETVTIVYNKNDESFLYDSNQIHADTVAFITGSSMVFTPIGGLQTFTDINGDEQQGYESIIIEITLVIEITLPNGSVIDTQTFTTTIIV
ncbi:MAG: prepilin-type N-terminal cleavage/methylation domain-containing protein [Candidatus Izemoplasma sp.]